MLSEEEKKAIEIFTNLINYLEKWNDNLTVVPKDKKYYKTLLNLITKLQKENEDLLREKEENKFIIAMANNEMLGYNQGYSDAENKNSNATEIVIKNRQAYIHKEEVELYKRKIDFLQKENEEKDKQIDLMAESIELQQYANIDTSNLDLVCEKLKCNKKCELVEKDCIKQYFADLVEKE